MTSIGDRAHVAIWALVAAFTLAGGVHVAAQSTEQEVMKAEQARVEARRKADSATLARIAPDDQLTVGPSGQVQGKKATAALAAAPKASLGELKTQLFGDVAVVTGVQAGFGANADQEHRFTRIWRRTNGQWLNLFGHVTRIQVAEPPISGATSKQVPQTVWPKGSNADEQAVIEILRRTNDAFAKKDTATYSTLTSANYLRIGPNGSQTREEFLKAVAGTPEQKRNIPHLSEFQVRMYGPVAVVIWLNRSINGSEAGVRRSRVFVKEGGTWKQLMSQDTPVTQS